MFGSNLTRSGSDTLTPVVQRLVQSILMLVVVAVTASACTISQTQIELTESTAAAQALPAIGPIPNFSHWHAAYVVRVCDEVLAPFDSDADPLGIHSHADGLMHVHPFFAESGYESATLQLFADAMDFSVSDGELTLPGGGTWRDGDLCNGVPGRVFVDRWSGPDPSGEVERIFAGIDDLRYEADGELYQIAFAPADSPPVVPPATAQLFQVSNLAPPGDPWITVDLVSEGDIAMWIIDAVGTQPCETGFVPEQGTTQCYAPRSERFSPAQVAVEVRAGELNRSPALDLRLTDEFRTVLSDAFGENPANPVGLALEVNNVVVTVALFQGPQVNDRLVLAGGFTAGSAKVLADRFN